MLDSDSCSCYYFSFRWEEEEEEEAINLMWFFFFFSFPSYALVDYRGGAEGSLWCSLPKRASWRVCTRETSCEVL